MPACITLRRIAIALWTAALLGCALACAGTQQPPARAPGAKASAPQAPADQLTTRSPDQISAEPSLPSKPLEPVPVPTDTAVAGSPPPAR
jgi:hypothetical protein